MCFLQSHPSFGISRLTKKLSHSGNIQSDKVFNFSSKFEIDFFLRVGRRRLVWGRERWGKADEESV